MKIYLFMLASIAMALYSVPALTAPITSKPLDGDKLLLSRAIEKWNKGDIASSKQQYLKLLERDPKNINALIGLAQIEDNLGNSKSAEAYFLTAFKHTINSAELYTAHGRYLLKQNRIDEAVNDFKKALSINPALPEANVELAVIKLSRFGDAAAAITLYKKALETKPQEISYLYGLSLALERAGNITQALEPLNIIINASPALVLPYKLKGNYHRQLQQYTESITNFTLALQKNLNPLAMDYVILADVYAESGNSEKAISTYRQAIEQYGENEVIQTKLAYVYHMAGDYEQAEVLYRKAISINPRYSEPYNNMVYIELRHKKKPFEALKFAKEAVEYSPENSNYLDTLATVYVHLKKYKQAKNIVTKALELSPDSEELKETLRRIEQLQ
ncbi:tetratricopeptide repeat protein [Paraglaciecola sp. 20A4]|uniref:tetratricopeptide repeat protein n=1 Tax=Paraglaciecola sp. 20A4 TaxID=2687288 RepID=UPI00140A7561|nr:tetratricopeptide repeat protein [Paraglaciecola sp. 20A4]